MATENRPTGPCGEALVNPSLDGGTLPWLFRHSELADSTPSHIYEQDPC
jgi:hypothetical protein